MKPQQLVGDLEGLDSLQGVESLCCFVTEDERPLSGAVGFLDWRLCGELSGVLRSKFFVGAPGDTLLLPTRERVPARRVFAVGLGKAGAVTALGLEHALAAAAGMLTRAQVSAVALAFPALPKDLAAARDELIARGFSSHFQGAVAVFSA